MHLVFWHFRMRPYHVDRYRALASKFGNVRLRVCLLGGEDDGPSSDEADRASFVTVDHFPPVGGGAGAVIRYLHDVAPDVVVLVGGYSHPLLRCAAQAARIRRSAVILCSDTTALDRRRANVFERAKSVWLRRYVGAALVSGRRARDYLVERLGMPGDRVCDGFDVVSPVPMWKGEDRRREDLIGVETRFFLFVGRLVEQKNLLRALTAYHLYVKRAKQPPWHLVVVGAGSEEQSLRQHATNLQLTSISWAGAKQRSDLRSYYRNASAFLLPSISESWGLVVNEAMTDGLPVIVSERCGCAPDLVQDGVNGFTFDPYDVEELAGLMNQVAAMTDAQRHAMGLASQRIIADWGPERFADGLMRAVQVAMRRPPPQASWVDQTLLWPLIHR